MTEDALEKFVLRSSGSNRAKLVLWRLYSSVVK